MIGFDPTQTYAFKLDVQGKRISQYLNPSEPKIHTACDGIIFSIIDGIFYVFFCEMKSKNPKLKDCIIKYRNSTLFINYIFNIKRILVYRIHHLDQKKEDEKKELLNIRRLDLKETLPSSKVSIIERQV